MKNIGDTTSFTIPEWYLDYNTGEMKTVTSKQLNLINAALRERKLVHLVMTGIENVERSEESTPAAMLKRLTPEENAKLVRFLQGLNHDSAEHAGSVALDLEKVEEDEKADEVEGALKEGVEESIADEDVDDILNKYTR